jgi:hypothetical protein
MRGFCIYILISYRFHVSCHSFVSRLLGDTQTVTCARWDDTDLVGLVLLDLLPELGVLLNADLLGGVELVEAAEIHVLGEQRNDVLVESLPVRVLKVVPMA